MKRILCLLLCLLLLTGCGPQLRDPGNFYYLRSEIGYEGNDGVIAPEERELQSIREDTGALLEEYFSGPVSSHLESPFPRDTKLLSWKMSGTNLQLELSQEFAQLSGVDLTIACACIARTFLELTPAASIRIHTDGALLNGSAYLYLSGDNLSLADDGMDKLRTDLTLYYADQEQRYLVGHSIDVNLAQQSDIIAYLVEQLTTVPDGLGLVSPLPAGTQLLESSVSDGICTLNFSVDFENNAFPQSYAQRTTLLSLANTLTQLEGIEGVEFQVDGSLLARYRQLLLGQALVYDESVIGPVRTGMNEFDATLFVSNGSQQYLAAVPTRVRQQPGISQAELVVQQLIAFQNENGFASPIPPGTVLNHLTIDNGLCTVDFTSDFLEDGNGLSLAVHAVVASVCALEGIDSAVITVDGGIPEGSYGGLFAPASPSSNWFL